MVQLKMNRKTLFSIIFRGCSSEQHKFIYVFHALGNGEDSKSAWSKRENSE